LRWLARADLQPVRSYHRRRSAGPAGCLRTILDAAETGTASEQVIMAVEQAKRRGWVTDAQLRDRARERGPRVADLAESCEGRWDHVLHRWSGSGAHIEGDGRT
jgi:hypothetical protein